MLKKNLLLYLAFLLLVSLQKSWSFVPSHGRYGGYKSKNIGRSNNNGYYSGGDNNSNNGGGNNDPPWSPFQRWGRDDDGDSHNMNVLCGLFLMSSSDEYNNDSNNAHDSNEATRKDDDDHTISLRGGSSGTKTANNNVAAGFKTTLAKTASYWSSAWKSASQTLARPFKFASSKISSMFKRPSKAQKAQQAAMVKLESIPVQAVKAPNSTLLPPEVISIAARRAGLIGKPLSYQAIQQMAQTLQQWYTRKGYVLASVTGATLDAESATAEIQVEEPIVSSMPVGITYCKEMVVDDGGDILTFRQYKGKHSKRRALGSSSNFKKSDLNTTFVTTSGRTNPERIARALHLDPGKPFQWDGSKWQSVLGSGIFGRILNASPQRMKDGTVQFHVVATERPPRNLEYGITKSLYTGSWEGEVDFENANLFGGGEVVGLTVKRGTKDAEPSVKVSFSDNKFGQAGGYDVDVFTDFIGEEEIVDEDKSDSDVATDYDHDALLSRRGATVRLANPVDTNVIRHSSASASLERTSTRSGYHESLASATFNVGPFRKDLPLDARSSLMASISTGARVPEGSQEGNDKSFLYKPNWSHALPYSSGTATARQVFPLLSERTERPISLALSHTVMTSTRNFPRHEANSAGIAAHVRGYDLRSNGPITTSVKGTTELRIPVKLPTNRLGRQDAGIVLYGDWLFAKGYRNDGMLRKSSVGAGIRKTVQGIPLKYDVSYTHDGKIGAFFGIGRDFDA